ncbi:MAG: hypothetical protein EA398_00045 [Deltaproteobacteria bacterium]|nr:MAG: hypothetical protein EA398_00045 [Deltaproteobacteria bacterium]
MSCFMRIPLLLAASLTLLFLGGASPAAHAGWLPLGAIPSGAFASDFAVGESSVVVVASEIDTSNLMRPWRARVYRSEDGGLSFLPIHGALGDEPASNALEAVAFRGGTVVVARGSDVLRLEGDVWSPHDAGAQLRAMEWLDGPRMVGVGKGGAIRISEDAGRSWRGVSSGTDVDLFGMFWRGDIGWVWGQDIVEIGGGLGDEVSREVRAGVLLESRDAGETWREVHRTQGRVLSAAWFGPGGRSFLATAELTRDEGPAARLELLRSDDGGMQWRVVDLPLEVGRVQVPIVGEEPIRASYVHAMHAGGSTIRLAATAHVSDASMSDSGGGTSTTQRVSDFRIVEYISYDDGVSWDADDLGRIEVSFSGNAESGDGEMVAGRMVHLHAGQLLAKDGLLWQLRTACADDRACLGSSACEAGFCGAPSGAGAGGSEGVGGPGDGGPANGGNGGRAPGTQDGDASGCAQTGGSPGSSALLGTIAAIGFAGLRRRRGEEAGTCGQLR